MQWRYERWQSKELGKLVTAGLPSDGALGACAWTRRVKVRACRKEGTYGVATVVASVGDKNQPGMSEELVPHSSARLPSGGFRRMSDAAAPSPD